MLECALIRSAWREPVVVLAAHADAPMTLALLSDGSAERGRWSYLACDPEVVRVFEPADPADPFAALGDLLGERSAIDPDGPPFQGGVAGLCAYELGARTEGVPLGRSPGWPDAVFARYLAVLAFDHQRREVIAVGRGATGDEAQARAATAAAWLEGGYEAGPAGALTVMFSSEDGEAYEAGVRNVVSRIGGGEIFQANIARRWRGRMARGARPYDLAARLARSSPAPFAAYLRLEDRAVVSNSPERFLRLDPDGVVESRPIKGTAPRGQDAAEDAELAARLAVSAKDRAENLMIVDLMRNDLSRVCEPGEVTTPDLFRVETFANVHHLVSTVRGVLKAGMGPEDLLRATVPPGSITGAPKVQAMKVIFGLEAPRGPFFGTVFWAGFDGAMDANVLIRTAAFVADADGWTVEARAGGGVVADSQAPAERAETEAKISALARALTGALR